MLFFALENRMHPLHVQYIQSMQFICSPFNCFLLIFLMAIQQMVKFFYNEGKGVDVGYLVNTSVSFLYRSKALRYLIHISSNDLLTYSL